jgi:hypothetical protein
MTKSLIETEERVLVLGRADLERCDNQVCTSKYNIFNFLPIVSYIEKQWYSRVL